MSERFVNVDDYARGRARAPRARRVRLRRRRRGRRAHPARERGGLRALGAAAARARRRRRGNDRDHGARNARCALPVLVAPTAFQRLCASRRASSRRRAPRRRAGTVMTPLDALERRRRPSWPRPLPARRSWFQLYWSRDRGFTQELVERGGRGRVRARSCSRSTCRVAGRRERDLRAAFALPDDLPAAEPPAHARGASTSTRTLHAVVDETLTWRDLEWLRSVCPLPLAGQGDPHRRGRAARRRARARQAVVVSNHGGRQLDGVPPTLDALPEVVEAVGERVEVLVDGGIRRGTDVAQGARARAHGRRSPAAPSLCGLAVDGEAGAAARARAAAPRARARPEAARLHEPGRGDCCPRAARDTYDPARGRRRR